MWSMHNSNKTNQQWTVLNRTCNILSHCIAFLFHCICYYYCHIWFLWRTYSLNRFKFAYVLILSDIQRSLKNELKNTVMPRVSFWLLYIDDTWGADGTHQAFTHSSLKFKHLSHHGIEACILAQKKQMSSFCSQEVTGGFRLTCCKLLASLVLLKGVQRDRNHVDPTLPTELKTGYGARARRLWTTLPTVLISCPCINSSLNHHKG